MIEGSALRVRAAVLRTTGAKAPFSSSRPLSVESVELDPPGPGELRVRIRAAGLCHSDLSAINGDRPWPTPLVVGHEAAGEVLGVGPGVTRFSPGDAVVMVFKPICGHCVPCLTGRGVLCEPGSASNASASLFGGHHRLSWMGRPLHHHMGVAAFSEQVVISEYSAVRLEPGLPWEVAALFGCAVLTGAGAVFNTGRVRAGDSVSVVGLGAVGAAALLAARAAGATTRIAVDRVPEKLDFARTLGATHVVLATDSDAVEQVRAASGGGVDRAFEMAGAVSALDLAYRVVKRGGTMVSAGLPRPDVQWPLQAVSLIAEEKTVQGSYMGSSVPARDIPRYISLYQQGLLPVNLLLDRIIGLDDLNEALDTLDQGRAVRQVVIF